MESVPFTVALAGSRRALDDGREDLMWAAFFDAMRHLRGELPAPPPYRFLITGLSAYVTVAFAPVNDELGTQLPGQRPAESGGEREFPSGG